MQALKKSKFVAIILIFILTLGIIPVNAKEQYPTQVVLGGNPFGLKLFTNGVIVIEINGDDSPAKNAGIKVNDIITKADTTEITSNEQLKEIIENSDGETITLTLTRNNEVLTKNIVPQKDENQNYVAGMWIRDSTAGIGTITYFDVENSTFGALGHGICDKDTGMLMPIRDGEIMSATISSLTKAQDGTIGGLNGYFDNEKIGNIKTNNDYGIYGSMVGFKSNRLIEVASEAEVKTGKATIVSTIDENGPQEFEVEITSLSMCKNSGQNMTIKVTDEKLLDKTGGIIQGMSGSPVIQDGKLVGAVTHVFINSPEKGYGIFIGNMLDCSRHNINL